MEPRGQSRAAERERLDAKRGVTAGAPALGDGTGRGLSNRTPGVAHPGAAAKGTERGESRTAEGGELPVQERGSPH